MPDRQNRPLVAGPDGGPSSPFPIKLSGPVIKGFGRGSRELGIPTANIPADGLKEYPDLESGVYYGVVALDPGRFMYTSGETANGDGNGGGKKSTTTVFPAVLSIGFNPYYKNTVRSVEIHIMAPFAPNGPAEAESQAQEKHFHKLPDFYGTNLNLLILGYIRPEYDYVSLEALVEDIRVDCEVARRSLARDAYACYLFGDDSSSSSVKSEREWLLDF